MAHPIGNMGSCLERRRHVEICAEEAHCMVCMHAGIQHHGHPAYYLSPILSQEKIDKFAIILKNHQSETGLGLLPVNEALVVLSHKKR